ncbi:pyrroline-5-carboxylate reductase [Sulfolobales archaeon HS-7]|nr:pyrroline-5-carboxylate reductase [Sulfolobales archaeon HS-7]
MERIAVIGSGKIGTAIIKSLKRAFPEQEIIATSRKEETMRKAKELGVYTTLDNDYAVSKSEIVILSVKPQHLPEVVRQVNRERWSGRKVISVLAGVRTETLSKLLPNSIVFRAMPNVNAEIGKSTTAIAESKHGEKQVVERIFKTLGTVYWIPEELLDVWTALIGSGPAFVAEILDAMALGAVACGMQREQAYDAILDMVQGTVENLRVHERHPIMLRDLVATPSGTTIRGLMTMEEEGIKAGIIKTILSANERSSKIGRDIESTLLRDET